MIKGSPGAILGQLVTAPLMMRLRPGGRAAGDSCFLRCPKCDAPAFIRRSERPSPTLTQLVAHCANTGCGHTFRCDIVFVHSICPGNIDRPDLHLPEVERTEITHVLPPDNDEDARQASMFEPPPDEAAQ